MTPRMIPMTRLSKIPKNPIITSHLQDTIDENRVTVAVSLTVSVMFPSLD